MREFIKHIHFVGIGGIGMSGIAEVLLELGFCVSGSDCADGAALPRLRKLGATVMHGHRAEHVEGAEAVVVSSAIAADNVELEGARARNIPIVPRAEMLGELMRFRRGIAIAGTHGKTTTTSLVAAVLSGAGLDPTFIVGGVVESARSNARLGGGEYMVVEADESDGSFLHLQPQLAVLTNIDADHIGAYDNDFDNLKTACLNFLHNLPFYGLAALCFADPVVREIAVRLRKPSVSYGFDADVDFRAVNVRQVGRDSFFAVEQRGRAGREYRLALPGRHNVLNALAAIAIAAQLGVAERAVRRALAQFEGIDRRFQSLGELRVGECAVQLVDDYAHHPTELAATLQAAHDCWPTRRLVAVFQPHRYTRTRDLFAEFVAVLCAFAECGVAQLIVTQVYPAGEDAIAAADGKALCDAVARDAKRNARAQPPLFVDTLSTLGDALRGVLRDGDVLLTLGAGDIGQFAQQFAAQFASPQGATS